MQKIKIILLLMFMTACAQKTPCVVPIEAETNAYRHNNMGIIYLKEKFYFGAIKEFQIAIDLLPDKQASSVFYTNLAKTYDKIGHHELSEPLYEKALSLDGLCFEYYLNLAQSYKQNKKLDEKLKYYQSKTNSALYKVMVGVIYIEKGHVATGITTLDNFCNDESELIIVPAIKTYIKKIVNEREISDGQQSQKTN